MSPGSDERWIAVPLLMASHGIGLQGKLVVAFDHPVFAGNFFILSLLLSVVQVEVVVFLLDWCCPIWFELVLIETDQVSKP
jgi:hypothetical protein